MTVVSNPLINMPVEVRSALCAEAAPLDEPARPSPMTWSSFRLSVDATRGPAFPVVVYDQTGSRPVAFVLEQGTGGFIVTCATPDRSAPRLDRAR